MALNEAVIERSSSTRGFLYLVMDAEGDPVSGSIGKSPIRDICQGPRPGPASASPRPTSTAPRCSRPARGMEERLPGGELLFVGADVGEAQGYVLKIVNALWGAAALVVVLGLAGGVLVSRDVSAT